MGKIKLKSFEFWICGNCQFYHYAYKFSDETTGFVKSYGTNHLLLVQLS